MTADGSASEFNGSSLMPRTLIVNLAVRYGGANSRVLKLLEELPSERVALAGLQGSDIIESAQELGLPVHIVGSGKSDPRVVSRLVGLIRQHNFQVVDTQNVQSKLWGSVAASRGGAALVSTLNSWYAAEHDYSLKGRIYQTIELSTNRNLDLYIVVSTSDRQQVLAAGYPEESVEVVLNAIEIDPDGIAGDRKWLLRKFDLPDDAVIACAVGRLIKQKGYPDLIAAMRQVAERQPHLYCLVAGDGRMRNEIAEQINRAGLQDRVRLIGFRDRDEVLSIVKVSDIFVMPSRHEGTPVALLEAAALARPIVATRAGGIPDLVSHQDHALLVDVGDSEGLATGINWVCDHPKEAADLGLRAQQHVMSDFDPKAQAEATMRAYRKAWARYQMRQSGRH